MAFFVDSDLHYGYDDSVEAREDKRDNPGKILNTIKAGNFGLICGDITDHGWDGKHLLCWKYGGDRDEYGAFRRNYYDPLTKNGLDLYLIAGNHDQYVPWPYFHKPINRLVERTRGRLYYSFDRELEDIVTGKTQLVHFVAGSIYPDAEVLDWMWKDLATASGRPTVIFFHYDLEGPFSDWWGRGEPNPEAVANERKENFYRVIKDHNIIGLFEGHYHANRRYVWKGFPVYTVGGPGFAIARLANGQLSVTFES